MKKRLWLLIALSVILVGGLAFAVLYQGALRGARARVGRYIRRHLEPTPASTFTAVPIPVATIAAEPAEVPTPSHFWQRLHLPRVGSAPPAPTATSTLVPTKLPTERPTPTPTLSWPAPLDQPSHSKVGIHVQWNNSPEIMEFIRRMKPAVVKAVGDFGFLAEVKESSPSTVTVARIEAPLVMEGDPAAAARAFVARHLEQYQLNPAVDYWEGMNEPAVRGRMAWYAAFEAERARVMAEHGFRVAVGAFSAGVPEWEEFAAFIPAIEAAQKHGGILTLHEYDAPTMDRSMGAGLPGHPNHPGRGALTFRYRWWYEDFLKPQGLVIPLVISEAGVDGGITNRPGPGGRGWQDFVGYWAEQDMGEDGAMAYVRQLAWYDAELQGDDYVIGCAVFTAGAMSDHWKSYDITHLLRHIATEIIVPNR